MPLSDVEIVKAILLGDSSKFNALYVNHIRHYMLLANRYMRSKEDAEDMVQEGLIKIFKNLSSFDSSRANFRTWSKRIILNTCLDYLRKNKLNYIDDFENLKFWLEAKEKASQNLELQDLTKLIQAMPSGYRTIFNMYVIDGYSHVEIAKDLNISVSTSKTQLLKAKKMLRAKITKQDQNWKNIYA